jgi:hypothetical protein
MYSRVLPFPELRGCCQSLSASNIQSNSRHGWCWDNTGKGMCEWGRGELNSQMTTLLDLAISLWVWGISLSPAVPKKPKKLTCSNPQRRPSLYPHMSIKHPQIQRPQACLPSLIHCQQLLLSQKKESQPRRAQWRGQEGKNVGWKHSTAQHSTAQHSTAQHSTAHTAHTAQHSTAQHSTAQPSPAQPSPAQPNTAQHSTAQHSTAQHSTAQHSTAQHSTAQFQPSFWRVWFTWRGHVLFHLMERCWSGVGPGHRRWQGQQPPPATCPVEYGWHIPFCPQKLSNKGQLPSLYAKLKGGCANDQAPAARTYSCAPLRFTEYGIL